MPKMPSKSKLSRRNTPRGWKRVAPPPKKSVFKSKLGDWGNMKTVIKALVTPHSTPSAIVGGRRKTRRKRGKRRTKRGGKSRRRKRRTRRRKRKR